jgi:uncharacterized surface anchored protein
MKEHARIRISSGLTPGSLLGTVRNSNGGAIAGAKVTITDAEKKVVVRTVTTTEEGQYSAPLLQAGVYDITVEAPSFKT